MAGVVIGSISLALTLLVYMYAAWRRLRKPQFWVTLAAGKLERLPDNLPESTKNFVVLHLEQLGIAFVGGGTARTLIDAGIQFGSRGGLSGLVNDVVPIPAELAGRFTLEPVGGTLVEAVEELPCTLRLDCGTSIFDVPFVLHRRGDSYFSIPPEQRHALLLGMRRVRSGSRRLTAGLGRALSKLRR